MSDAFAVSAAAGSLRSSIDATVELPHRWTDAGVAVSTQFTGAHLLHLAAAACVLNDLYREAERLGVVLDGVRVDADGGFDTETWESSGITYRVELDSADDHEKLSELVLVVDQVAEIPRTLRAGMGVSRR
jgi:uncharacterized OsmC-like protein